MKVFLTHSKEHCLDCPKEGPQGEFYDKLRSLGVSFDIYPMEKYSPDEEQRYGADTIPLEIEITSLEELINLHEMFGYSLVFGRDWKDEKWQIEIYNDYRE